jgi:hypothetical protein
MDTVGDYKIKVLELIILKRNESTDRTTQILNIETPLNVCVCVRSCVHTSHTHTRNAHSIQKFLHLQKRILSPCSEKCPSRPLCSSIQFTTSEPIPLRSVLTECPYTHRSPKYGLPFGFYVYILCEFHVFLSHTTCSGNLILLDLVS